MRSIYLVCVDPLVGANGAYTYDIAAGAYRSQSNSTFYIQQNDSTNDWELYSLSQGAPPETKNILYKLGGSLSEPVSMTSLGSTSWTTVNGTAPVPVTHVFTHTMCGSVTVYDINNGSAAFLSGTYALQTTIYGVPYYTKGTDLFIDYVTDTWVLFYNDPATPDESTALHELLGTFSINDPPVGQWTWVGGAINENNNYLVGPLMSYVSDECINCGYGYNGDPGGTTGDSTTSDYFVYTKNNVHYIRYANNQSYIRKRNN